MPVFQRFRSTENCRTFLTPRLFYVGSTSVKMSAVFRCIRGRSRDQFLICAFPDEIIPNVLWYVGLWLTRRPPDMLTFHVIPKISEWSYPSQSPDDFSFLKGLGAVPLEDYPDR